MAAECTYTFKNDLSELGPLSRAVDRFGQKLGLNKKCLFEIHLALEEHFTNVVSHGYQDDHEHTIKVSLVYADQAVEIKIEDDGVEFNPLETSAPDVKCRLEDRKIGGLGIHITRHCVDEIDYQRQDDRNVLILKKYVSV